MIRFVTVFSMLLCAPQSFSDSTDFRPNVDSAGYDPQTIKLGDLAYPLPARSERCERLQHLRTASDPLEIFSLDGSLPACVDNNLAQFMRIKSRVPTIIADVPILVVVLDYWNESFHISIGPTHIKHRDTGKNLPPIAPLSVLYLLTSRFPNSRTGQ